MPLIAWSTGCDLPTRTAPGGPVEAGFNLGGPPATVIAADELVFRIVPLFDSIPGRSGSHAPSITALPDGELLAAWYSYSGPGELNGSAIYMARRPAGRPVVAVGQAEEAPGDSWEPPALHIDRSVGDGNPVLYSEGDKVRLFQAVIPGGWSTAHIEWQRSDDRGHTWSEPHAIAGPLGSNVRFAPVRTSDGTLLLPAYDDLLQRSLFFGSADGQRWTLRSSITTPPPHQNLQPSVAVLGDGRLLAVMRNHGQGWLWVTASDDDGRTWAAPADSGFPNPASPALLLRLASGNLILIYNDSATLRRPLSVAISGDEGVTWYPPRVLVDGDGAYAYPSAVQTPDGLIHVVYSHNRERIVEIAMNEAWIVGGSGSR